WHRLAATRVGGGPAREIDRTTATNHSTSIRAGPDATDSGSPMTPSTYSILTATLPIARSGTAHIRPRKPNSTAMSDWVMIVSAGGRLTRPFISKGMSVWLSRK